METPVIVLGDVLVDRVYQIEALPPPGGDAAVRTVEEFPGGAGLNVSVGLAALGVPCRLAATVGDDPEGDRLLGYLSTCGVEVAAVARRGTTGHVLSLVDRAGERTMFSFRGAAAAPVELTPQLEAALEVTPLLFFSGYGLQSRSQAGSYLTAARRVKEHGGLVALDPAPVAGAVAPETMEEALAVTDILLPNEAELKILAGSGAPAEAVPSILERVSVLGLKRGAAGSFVASAAGIWECPAAPVVAVDTTGAGDAFDAGFLAALLRGLPPPVWGEEGNRLAARAVTKRGAPVA